MYLPRPLLPSLYTTLLQTTHPSSAPLLLLVAPTVDALCAARILTAQLRRDFVPHKLRCVSGYADLQRAGEEEVKGLRRDGENGGQGGVVVCLGCGGGVDMGELLGLTGEDEDVDGDGGGGHGVEVWVVDSHRSWNLENVFAGSGRGVVEGKLGAGYRTGSGVIVWDEGDIESELGAEREAWFALRDMPEITEEDMAIAEGEDSEEEGEDAEAGAEEDEVPTSSQPRKRKASSQENEDDDMDFSSSRPPARRRRSNSSSSIALDQPPPSSQPTGSPTHNSIIPSSPPRQKRVSQKQLRKQLLDLRRKHEKTLESYYDRGSWTGEACSSILYSLVSELGREDNELLWLAVVGVESVVLSPFTTSTSLANSESRSSGGRRGQPSKLELVKAVLRDEVRRLNPPDLNHRRGASGSVVGGNTAGYDDVPTTARSATDTSIRLSPEPRFLLIRHWSLLDSMLHTTYLATRLHLWNEQGRKRLNKLLAKMGISLQEAGKGYLHLDLEVKRTLRARVGKFAEQYGLEGLVPEGDHSAGGMGKGEGFGFVRSWGWRGTLSAGDVVSVVSAILEVGAVGQGGDGEGVILGQRDSGGGVVGRGYGQRVQGLPSPPHSSDDGEGAGGGGGEGGGDWATERFFAAYDALSPTSSSPSASTYTSLATSGAGPRAPNQQGLPALLAGIPVAQGLARAILRTGSALISKNQIRHLRSFRLGVVKEGPDVVTFRHPGALVKLAGWVGEAVGVLEGEKTGRARGAAVGKAGGDDGEALVLGCLDEGRGVYVVVGLSSGSGMSTRNVGKTRKEKEEAAASKKRTVAERAAKKVERRREKAEEKKRKRERDEANGLLDSDDEGEDSDGTEDSESSESSGSDSEDDEVGGVRGNGSKRGTRNRFGQAFQEVVVKTGARVRIDSFEHSVVEVRKEDLAGFLEGLSGRGVVG
ncbi:DNA replication initiation factor cdc45 [Elasticomyces elasticus]|uniref:DNA replication initiation factor cdc45 n=1 Tax=Elasticomyces elasticus TaxID=574655 RepID=A0AAN7ZLK7_9PEZI|nr:DNA replication initiation factor cdc45 [Elasticomyces elasticus]